MSKTYAAFNQCIAIYTLPQCNSMLPIWKTPAAQLTQGIIIIINTSLLKKSEKAQLPQP